MSATDAVAVWDQQDITFFAWPRSWESSPQRGSLCILGAPSDVGNAISRGAALGPTAIRRASLGCPNPVQVGYDLGDVALEGDWGSVSHLGVVEAAIRSITGAGMVPLMIGGDHSLTFAPVSVLQEELDICLVWFDAHTDFSPWDGREFHNHKQVLRRIETLAGVTRLVQFGYRGVTVGDERRLGPKACVVTSSSMRRMDPEEWLDLIPQSLPCYVSIDIDVIDPFIAPGTSAPVPGGILPGQLVAFLDLIAQRRWIVGADVVEVNPWLDRNDDTSRIAVTFVEALVRNWHCQTELHRAVGRGLSGRQYQERS